MVALIHGRPDKRFAPWTSDQRNSGWRTSLVVRKGINICHCYFKQCWETEDVYSDWMSWLLTQLWTSTSPDPGFTLVERGRSYPMTSATGGGAALSSLLLSCLRYSYMHNETQTKQWFLSSAHIIASKSQVALPNYLDKPWWQLWTARWPELTTFSPVLYLYISTCLLLWLEPRKLSDQWATLAVRGGGAALCWHSGEISSLDHRHDRVGKAWQGCWQIPVQRNDGC